ncbi:nitrate- and nitrite sensing domain-containing protein [Actinoplanes sp. NBC_00393]|uniref:sensor histidine kinase n=1 Tax=Actinoplanes sp. NBC_00393 TaxID=2975953 RepID=UPI002E23C951
MSTGSSTLAARRGGFPRLRDARIRAKLAGLLFLPLAAVLGLAAVRLVDVGERAGDAGRVADMAELGTDLSNLTRLLHDERMAALAYLGSPDAAATEFRESVKSVDAQVQVFRENRAAITEVPAPVTDRLTRIDQELTALPQTRAGIGERKGVGVADAAQRYTKALTSLSGYETAVSQVAEPGEVSDNLRALAAFTKAEAAAAEQAALTYVARVSGDAGPDQLRALYAIQAVRTDALNDFRTLATAQQISLVDSTLSDDTLAGADGLAARLAGPAAVAPVDIINSFTDVIELFRGVERQLDAQAVAAAEDASKRRTQQATLEFVVVLLILIAAVAMAFYLGRSLHLSVRRLREGALAVANRDLPDAVHRLQDADNLGEGGVDRIIAQTRDPIPVTEADEFGQVAEAFNMVHREAIRVAAEQAALRTSVSTMFLSLARRSQSLVDRMIGELDQIERMEEDPKRLARLFELDHLATRMRRNDENLLVLAGAEVGAPRREDALLVDALRAAQSEVELYHRIEFGSIDTDILIGAAAVNDVVRLIAELLDNATRFSPPNTVVVAHGGRTGDHVVVQVEDHGLGVSAEQREQINRRLAEPSEVDVTAFRLMGFAVIARLAARHGIGVELRPGYDGGTVAEISLPADIVVMPGVPAAPVRAASWTRPGPPPPASISTPRIPESRPPIRSAPAPAEPAFRPPRQPTAPPSELDLRPTPDRPPLPSRSPKTVEVPVPAAASAGFAAPAGVTTPAGVTSPGWGAAVAALPSLPEVAAQVPSQMAPIQVEMQHSWFAGDPADQHGMPTAGYAPPPGPAPAVQVSSPPVSSPPISSPPVSSPPAAPRPPVGEDTRRIGREVPKAGSTADDRWKTAADEGWHRAMAAAMPADGGTTRSGLPKRVPQAQLVPGGVQSPQRAQNRRSPDEVRGLLSAYHRGVQRGRTDGVADVAAAAPQVPKESEQ